MSLLYRFAKIPDRWNTHVFTFIVTKSVTRDLHRDVTSKEFMYGYQKWAITFSRTEKVLGVYLVWRNPSEGMRVLVDFSFTLLNREHFSANETFSGKSVKFTYDSPAQGNRRYIPVHDLYARNFADRNGEFQLELTMCAIRTHFEVDLRTPAAYLASAATPHHHHHHHKFSNGRLATNPPKMESTYFNFGGFDWNIIVYPFGREPGDERVFVHLNRLTGFDHQCRVRYVMILGEGERNVNSGLLDDISDANGKTFGWVPRIRLMDIVQRGLVHIHLEMVTANTLSEVALVPQVPTTPNPVLTVSPATSGTSTPPATESQAVMCFDRDKQAWTLEADTHSETLRVRMVYKDVHNVPRNHLRYVSWSAYLLRYNSKTGLLDPISCTHAPYSHYYVQEEADDGIIMETDVTVKESPLKSFRLGNRANGEKVLTDVRDPNSFYLNDKRQVRIQIEWGESYLLFQATYHKYDDVTRVHNFQMRREIGALQAENYSLERQLFSYQKSIAYAHAHQHHHHPPSQGSTTPRGGSGIPHSPAHHHHPPHSGENSYEDQSEDHHQHNRPFLERGVSTDTELSQNTNNDPAAALPPPSSSIHAP